MSSFSTTNHLITKRIKTSFSKNKQLQSKSKKAKDKKNQTHQDPVSINLSMDVKNYMLKDKLSNMRHHTNNTINFDEENLKHKKRNNLFFSNSRKDNEGAKIGSVKMAYAGTPTGMKSSFNNNTSQKSIKQKRKRLSLTSGIRQNDSFTQNRGTHHQKYNMNPNRSLNMNANRNVNLNPDKNTNLNANRNQTVNIQKHIIISKYEKVKQLLKNEKYAQAIVYLKQIIPHIEQKQKKKQLYFWFIASLMKSSIHSNRLEIIENYIVECLEEFPNFYDIYLYWAKIKQSLHQKQEAIEIYQKAITINCKSSEAYIELSNLYLKRNSYKEAFRILQQAFTKAVGSISICIKIIENYKIFNLSITNDLKPYIERVQAKAGKKSTEYLYVLGFAQKQNNNQNQALIFFLQSLKHNSNRNMATKSLQNIINIHIGKRDFYAACYDLKRSKHLNIDFKKIQKYEIFLEGVNFVMKKQNQDGIKFLNRILQNSKYMQSKKKINSFFVKNNLLQDKSPPFDIDKQMFSLTVKYLAYAYFKLGNHKDCIKSYKLLEKNHHQLDYVSKYNLALARGIILADIQNDFDASLQKFEQAKAYLNKVQPLIYQAMVTIQQKMPCTKEDLKKQSKKSFPDNIVQRNIHNAVMQALHLMQQGQNVNSSSSNLLYHRAILHLFFSSFKLAMQDINLCIQKAEQNLPKYFYLRGICYACLKNLKKASNQFSISISLNKQYSVAYLQRAKCYFLSGQTQMGFHDLKIYMEQCPDDYHVHKWIGDLLFEGTSYNDCIKAFNQMGSNITLEALCMRFKAELRVSSIKKINQSMNEIKSHPHFKQQAFVIDMAAYSLMINLATLSNNSSVIFQKQKSPQSIEKKLKNLNSLIEKDNEKGDIFNLVDCMNLIGIGYFYLEKYTEAYESFLLVLQFLKSTKNQEEEDTQTQKSQYQNSEEKIQKQHLNTQFQEQNLDLREEDVYFNIFLCFLASKQFNAAMKMAQEQMLTLVTGKTQRKVIQNIITFIKQNPENLSDPSISRNIHTNSSKSAVKVKLKKELTNYILETRVDSSLNLCMKKFEISIGTSQNSLKVKTSPIWTSYHGSNENLYFSTMARKLAFQLHAGYIDNMPQGPWIRRNKFGVLFTDNILDEANQLSFITTFRAEQQQNQTSQKRQKRYDATYQLQQEQAEYEAGNITHDGRDNIEDIKKAFLKQMKLDLKIQNKLNKILKKSEH